MEKTPSSLAKAGGGDTTSKMGRKTTSVLGRPLPFNAFNGPRCPSPELRERLEIWFNEGGAGGEVNE